MPTWVWFWGQLGLVLAGMWLGNRVARASARVWKTAAVAATIVMLAWPLTRFYPTVGLAVLGAGIMVFTEGVGIVIPAAVVFAIAARHASKASERRAIRLLLVVCVLFYFKTGAWMIRQEVPELGKMRMWNGTVCEQSTGYTCVAASLVTQLKAYGIDATETEMARLSFTEVNGGTTDTRAVYALEQKLGGLPIDVKYRRMSYEQLCAAPKPCVVALEWGYFISHMVPVMSCDALRVVLGDPLTGTRAMRAADFRAVWKKSGIYLIDRRGSASKAAARG